MVFLSTKETALKWDISQRRVNVLCSEGRIPGATQVGQTWIIPAIASKPIDARTQKKYKISKKAKPFLKWAGGKNQLLPEIRRYYPFERDITITKYAEPFVGGGAVLFDILNRYELDAVYISDINVALIDTYITIRDNLDLLLTNLSKLETQFLALDPEQRKTFYYRHRSRFNDLKRTKVNKLEIATKNTAGDSATNVISASGTCNQYSAITCAPTNNSKLPIKPIIANVANAILKILFAPLLSPIAILSETNFDIAFGTPIDDIVSNIAYI